MDNIFSVKDAPNIIADGIQDDYQALQNYLNNLPSGATLHFENYRVYCSQSISIDKPLLLTGNVLNTACITTNGNCIIINSSDVIIQNFAIGNNPRYSDSVNTNVGIIINGNANNHLTRITINNVIIDGFKKALDINYLWNSQIMSLKVYYCNVGIEINGLSVNNEISNNTSLLLAGEDSYGIHFTGNVPTEGWRIINTLIFGAKFGIWAEQTSHINILNSMIDFCGWIGVYLGSPLNSLEPNKIGCYNWNISHNYIAMTGNAGSAIYLNNSIPNIYCRGNKITNNDFLVYPDSYADRGVHQEGIESKYDLIQGNSFLNFRTFDIETAVGTYAIVANNFMLSDHNTISCYVSDDTKFSDNHTKGNVVVK